MTFVRKLFLFFSTFMLVVTLLLVSSIWTVNNTVTDRDIVKAWVADSGLYDNIVDEVAKVAEEEIDSENSPDDGGIETELLTRVAGEVFTAQLLQEKLEPLLDGIYDWLEGENPSLSFTIDLEKEKVLLAQSLAGEASNRLLELPLCSTEQLEGLQNVDVFSVQCQPEGFAQLVDDFYREFSSSEEFLPDATFTADDIKIEVNGEERTIASVASTVPAYYQFARNVVWFTLIASILWIALVLFLSKNIRYGLKHVATAFVIASILVFTSAITATLGNQSLNVSGDSFEDKIIVPFAQQTLNDVSRWGYIFGAVYLAVGVIIFMYITISRKMKLKNADQSEPKNSGGTNPPDTTKSSVQKKTAEADSQKSMPTSAKEDPKNTNNDTEDNSKPVNQEDKKSPVKS